MRLLAGWAGQLCAGDRAFCLVYEVNGQVGVRMGRRRKYLINAYTKSLIVLHIPLFFFHFFLYFLLRAGTVYSFSLSHAYSYPFSGLYLQGKCCWCVCAPVQLARLPHCTSTVWMCYTGFHTALLVLSLHVHLVPLFISAAIWTENHCVISMFLPLTAKAVVAVLWCRCMNYLELSWLFTAPPEPDERTKCILRSAV